MGSEDGLADEKPQHHLVLPAFLIDRLPVTNAAFAEFLDANGWRNAAGRRYYDVDDGDARIHRRNGKFAADSGYSNHAVVEPSWIGAVEYCRWRGKPTSRSTARDNSGRYARWY
jgi:formylglycine-generating enzyme required for sulfatase activity